MIYLAIISGLLVLALVYREAQHSQHSARREASWDLERGALLTRILHPEVIPVPQRPMPAPGDEEEQSPEADEIDLVGAIMDNSVEGAFDA